MSAPGARLYVGQLPAGVEEATVREAFARFGKIQSCLIKTPVARPGATTPVSSWTHIVFENQSSVTEAIAAADSVLINGQKVKIEEPRAKPVRTPRAPQAGSAPRQPKAAPVRNASVDAARVYVGNLPFQYSDAELKQEFSRFGNVTRVLIPKSWFRGQASSRGFGFVSFEKAEEVSAALAASDVVIKGRTIRIASARAPTPKVTAFISGIPEGTTVQEIEAVLGKFGVAESNIVKANTSDRKGFAFVKFNTPEGLINAVKECGTMTLHGGESRCSVSRGSVRAPFRRNRGGPRRAARAPSA